VWKCGDDGSKDLKRQSPVLVSNQQSSILCSVELSVSSYYVIRVISCMYQSIYSDEYEKYRINLSTTLHDKD